MYRVLMVSLLAVSLIVGAVLIAGAGGVRETVSAIRDHDVKFVLGGFIWQPMDRDEEVAPLIYQGRTYLPIRAIAEAIGVGIHWDAATRTITLELPDDLAPSLPGAELYRTEDEVALSAELRNWIETHRRSEGVHVMPDGDQQHLLITMGERMTGGYRVELVDVDTEADTVTVTVRYVSPDPEDMVTQAITHPYLYLKINSRDEITVVRQDTAAELFVYRSDVAETSSDIVVAGPLPYEMVSGSFVVRGEARTTEPIMVDLEDGHRVLVSGQQLTTGAGSDGWVTFEGIVTYTGPSSQIGTLLVYAGDKMTLVPLRFGDWDYDHK